MKTHPGDLRTRRQLLSYYLHRHRDPAPQDARIAQIAWMVAHHPEVKLFDDRAWIVDARGREGFARVRTLWLKKARQLPGNPQMPASAALVLSLSDRRLAARWMKTPIAKHSREFPEMKWRLGMLCADVVLGLTARTPYYAPGPVDAAEAELPYAREVLEEVRRSRAAARPWRAERPGPDGLVANGLCTAAAVAGH